MPTTKPRAGATVDLTATLASEGHQIGAMAFDRTGQRLAVASGPGSTPASGESPARAQVRVIEVRTGAVLHELTMPTTFAGDLEMPGDAAGSPVALDFSPDGRWLAVTWPVDVIQYVGGGLAIVDLTRGEVSAAYAVGCPGPGLAFSPDSRLLATTGHADDGGLVWCALDGGASWGEPAVAQRTSCEAVAFGVDGRHLVVLDARRGVSFVDVRSRKRTGQSSDQWLLENKSGFVAAPDGRSALVVCSAQRLRKRRTRGSRRGLVLEKALWRWRPGAAPERVASVPSAARGRGWTALWIAPDASAVLWADPTGALVRQRFDRRLLARPRPAPSATTLGARGWDLIVASADGASIARQKGGLVLVTRVRRRSRNGSC